MTTLAFLSLLAAALALVGAGLTVRSVGRRRLGPAQVRTVELPPGPWSPEAVRLRAARLVDARLGAVCVALAVLLELGGWLGTGPGDALGLSPARGAGAAVVFLLACLLAVSVAGAEWRQREEVREGREAVRLFCEVRLSGGADPLDVAALSVLAEELLGMGRGHGEPQETFVARISREVGWVPPVGLDYSEAGAGRQYLLPFAGASG